MGSDQLCAVLSTIRWSVRPLVDHYMCPVSPPPHHVPLLAIHDTSIDEANYIKHIILGNSVPSFVRKIRKANYFRVQMYSKIIDNCTNIPKYS